MIDHAETQLNLFEEPDQLSEVTAELPTEEPLKQRRRKERPVRYPDLMPHLELNDLMVERRTAEAEDRNRRKEQGLPRKVKTDAEKAEDREWQAKWIDSCRLLTLRGHEPLAVPDLVEEVKRRAVDDPGRYGLITDKERLNPDSIVFLNCGAGQDSVAMVVLLVLGLLPDWIYNHNIVVVMADTMAERPNTYAYILNELIPFMDKYGVEFVWLRPNVPYYYGLTEGDPELSWLDEALEAVKTESQYHVTKNRTLAGLMETYMGDLHPSYPMWSSRARCTTNHKHGVLARYRDAVRVEWNGRQAGKQTAQGYRDWVLVGIANDETGRAEPTADQNYLCLYPLIGYNLDRAACVEVIEAAGISAPPKSGCVVCYAAPIWERWYISQVHPAVFAQMMKMERLSIADRQNRTDKNGKATPLKPNYMCMDYDLPLAESVQRWHEENPHVTVDNCAEWLINRSYNRDAKPDKCSAINADQLTFDLGELDEDDALDLLERVEAGEFELAVAGD